MDRYQDVALMVDHSLLRPQLTRAEVEAGLDLAKSYGVASATMRPCDIDIAVKALAGTAVKAGGVVGFPHGSSSTAAKLFETRELLDRGAREIDVVIAISRLLSHDLDYVQAELDRMAELCHRHSAILKVIFENAYLSDADKIRLCELCGEIGVDWVKTSTGFAPGGATMDDLRLMRKHSPPQVQVKAAGGIRDLDTLLEVRAIGVTRVGATRTAQMLDDWRRRLGSHPVVGEEVCTTSSGS